MLSQLPQLGTNRSPAKSSRQNPPRGQHAVKQSQHLTISSTAASVAAMLCGSSCCDCQPSCSVKTRGGRSSLWRTLFFRPQPPTSCKSGAQVQVEVCRHAAGICRARQAWQAMRWSPRGITAISYSQFLTGPAPEPHQVAGLHVLLLHQAHEHQHGLGLQVRPARRLKAGGLQRVGIVE